jgi:L-aspartate oxidase
MPEFHPSAELAPRDVVSRAVFRRMVDTRDTSVYLDLSEIDGDPHTLFPGISRVCRVFGIDIARDPIPVRPGAHYHIGGIRTDLDGRSSLPGLWAVGECASSGLHGANRMGSNSLLEGLVLGMRTGGSVTPLGSVPSCLTSFGDAPERRSPQRSEPGVSVNIEDLIYSLKSMMWRQMGVQRSSGGMEEANEKLGFWSRVVQDLADSGPRSWELLNMLTVSRLATISALAREESRGVHYRTDVPTPSEESGRHTLLTPSGGGLRIDLASIDWEPVRGYAPRSS